jgi:hypothetical protein
VSKNLALLVPAIAAGGLLLFSAGASAQLLYCCKDEKHVSHCSDNLPPKCIGRAYTVRGKNGKLVKDVSAPLTPEQLTAKEELDKKQKLDEVVRKEQALKDKALLSTYSSAAEIDKARERAEKDVADGVKQSEAKLAEAEKKRSALVDKNVIKERMAPEEMRRRIGELDHEVTTLKEVVDAKRKDLESVRAKFDEDKRRYTEIKNRSQVRMP